MIFYSLFLNFAGMDKNKDNLNSVPIIRGKESLYYVKKLPRWNKTQLNLNYCISIKTFYSERRCNVKSLIDSNGFKQV